MPFVGEYAAEDSRIKLIERPGSYGAAVNRGIEQAQSDFIGIVEADDWIAPHMYENFIRQLVKQRPMLLKRRFISVMTMTSTQKHRTFKIRIKSAISAIILLF